MTEKDFSLRLAKLRTQKGVSVRDMSLSMGKIQAILIILRLESLCHR